MNIHEYQAKKLLAKYGVPVPRGGVAHSATGAIYQANELGGDKWIVKAQVHSGARGKAGGVKLCESPKEISQFCDMVRLAELSYVSHLKKFHNFAISFLEIT